MTIIADILYCIFLQCFDAVGWTTHTQTQFLFKWAIFPELIQVKLVLKSKLLGTVVSVLLQALSSSI